MDNKGIRQGGGNTGRGSRTRWTTSLDAETIRAREKSKEICVVGFGKRWVDQWNKMMPEVPKTLGALSSRYRKIVGTPLIEAAIKWAHKNSDNPESNPSEGSSQQTQNDQIMTDLTSAAVKDELRKEFRPVLSKVMRNGVGDLSQRNVPSLQGRKINKTNYILWMK